ncbi:hypothetical protein [Glycomyces tenuis]|uniref:hypothetical protein n=1 Tax=Glycomyces tenuis TaxID=58116 RepID=UPI0004178A84|nr:hypothetical protein [Glycomyces tenuis]
MVALAVWRDNRCNQCGGDLEETTSEENDGTPGHGAYLPLLPIRCHRCTALAKSEAHYRDLKAEHPHALIHRVELHPPRIA